MHPGEKVKVGDLRYLTMRKEASDMGISRDSLGQIRDILRKLDHSIDSAREKRLSENQRRLADRDSDRRQQNEDPNRAGRSSDLDQRIG